MASSSASTETSAPATFVTASGPTIATQNAVQQKRGPDTLDKTVLKIIRYTSKLVLAGALSDPSSELAVRLKALESSIGTSRKAYRLGKWLADLNAIRKTPLTTRFSYLEILASGGEGVYYFVEQLTWLVKAGVIPQQYARRFNLISAWGELVSYVGSIWLNALRIAAALERERALSDELLRRKKEGEQGYDGDSELRKEVRALQERRLLRTLAVIQDVSDSMLALNDIRDGQGRLSSPAVLSVCGLISAFISFRKNWLAI
ncbi:hypothetical protein CVIRNUC_009155 [Coccomyxa viridis]|uniref:Peroxisomal biogenesis factor 11 n=1 Tax=Coccomyxa viridis TaxID=1274662 RepID=A0AAV1IFE2_9CHLO|nr:hypothetical protein CVIRNUC_009155 [Coccomyxa viridis]